MSRRIRCPKASRAKSLYLNRGHSGWLRSCTSRAPSGRSPPRATRSDAVVVYQLFSVTEYWLAPLLTRVTSAFTMSPITSASNGEPLSLPELNCFSSPIMRTPGAKNVVAERTAEEDGFIESILHRSWPPGRSPLLPPHTFQLFAKHQQHDRAKLFDLLPIDTTRLARGSALRARIRRRRDHIHRRVDLVNLHRHGSSLLFAYQIAGMRNVIPTG